jgi:hypothetical protein
MCTFRSLSLTIDRAVFFWWRSFWLLRHGIQNTAVCDGVSFFVEVGCSNLRSTWSLILTHGVFFRFRFLRCVLSDLSPSDWYLLSPCPHFRRQQQYSVAKLPFGRHLLKNLFEDYGNLDLQLQARTDVPARFYCWPMKGLGKWQPNSFMMSRNRAVRTIPRQIISSVHA